jgi:hypothetical protein
LVYVAYHRVVLPAHNEGFAPFDFLWSFVKPAWWLFFPIVHLFWSWLYVVLRLRLEGVGTLADLREAFHERRILDVETVIIVALVGLGPGLVIHIDGGSAFYFSDVQRWLSIAFLLSWAPAILRSFAGEPAIIPTRRTSGFLSRLDDVPIRRVVVGFLLIPIVGSVLSNSIFWPIAALRFNVATRHALYPAAVASKIPLGVHGFAQLDDPALLKMGLESSPNYPVAVGLRRFSQLPDSVRHRTALFIPQDQRPYWASLTRKGACTFQPFVAPALASIMMIDGMPAYGCSLSKYYGIGSYFPRTRPQLSGDLKKETLCSRAAPWGIDRVILVTFDDSRTANSTTYECPQQL